MNDYGLKVSLPGKDITSLNPLDYVFHSKYGSVKIVQQGAQVIQINAGFDTITTIPHNLGFVPLAMVFTELNPGSGRYYSGISLAAPEDNATGLSLSDVDGSHTGAKSFVDSNNLVLDYFNNSASKYNVSIYYYLFGDSGG